MDIESSGNLRSPVPEARTVRKIVARHFLRLWRSSEAFPCPLRGMKAREKERKARDNSASRAGASVAADQLGDLIVM